MIKKKRQPGHETDYRNELNAEEKEWLKKFDQEYCFGSFTDSPLHTIKQRREIGRRRYKFYHDVANPQAAYSAFKSASNTSRKRAYGPSDYTDFRNHTEDSTLEDSIIELLDSEKEQKC